MALEGRTGKQCRERWVRSFARAQLHAWTSRSARRQSLKSALLCVVTCFVSNARRCVYRSASA